MSIRIADLTLALIDHTVEKDQGALFRWYQGKVLPHIGDAYRSEEEGHRSHMGASLIGGECARAIWYNFRWAAKPKFKSRILRLFNRGHLEEGRFISLLLMCGFQVFQQDENGKQFRISHAGGHFGGSGDGVVIGLPDLQPGQAALCEFKTHGESSFIELAGKNWKEYSENLTAVKKKPVGFTGKGVRVAKFEHYVQMQVYMRKMGLAVALYVAVNKNTDELYAELVTLDPETADLFLDRGEKLVFMTTPPAKINSSPGFFKCRFCDMRSVCHLDAAPDVNCRTCAFSQPLPDGTWHCHKLNQSIPKELQLTGCDYYTRNQDL